jgi:hypothetical protein
MNEQSAEMPRALPPDLKALVRRAKLEDAERSSVVAELRGAEQARLELLRDALEPVFAQVPPQAELFDHGLVPGEKPRLFIEIGVATGSSRTRARAPSFSPRAIASRRCRVTSQIILRDA